MMMKPSRDQLVEDEQFLKMIDNRKDWPSQFLQSEDVYCKNPLTLFNTQEPSILQDGRYFFVNRTVNSGKTDGCESGCWRVMGRDKLIESKLTGKILGFKKILKFCEKVKHRKDNISWVMEEYRLVKKGKQDQVICKIRLMVQTDISFLLAKHFSYLYKLR